MHPLTTEHCGSVHYITIGDSRLLTAAGLTQSPLYLIGDAASRCGLSRVGYFIPLNGRRPLNGHPPSYYYCCLTSQCVTVISMTYFYCRSSSTVLNGSAITTCSTTTSSADVRTPTRSFSLIRLAMRLSWLLILRLVAWSL